LTAASFVSPVLLLAVELGVLLAVPVVLPGKALPTSPLQAVVSSTSPVAATRVM
jgi:hypothetical protein